MNDIEILLKLIESNSLYRYLNSFRFHKLSNENTIIRILKDYDVISINDLKINKPNLLKLSNILSDYTKESNYKKIPELNEYTFQELIDCSYSYKISSVNFFDTNTQVIIDFKTNDMDLLKESYPRVRERLINEGFNVSRIIPISLFSNKTGDTFCLTLGTTHLDL